MTVRTAMRFAEHLAGVLPETLPRPRIRCHCPSGSHQSYRTAIHAESAAAIGSTCRVTGTDGDRLLAVGCGEVCGGYVCQHMRVSAAVACGHVVRRTIVNAVYPIDPLHSPVIRGVMAFWDSGV